MTTPGMSEHRAETEFDGYAEDYARALHRGLRVSGEDQAFFARARLMLLASCLRDLNEWPRAVLDFGCGTGGSTRQFIEVLGATSVLGLDLSEKSLEVARRTHDSLPVRFERSDRHCPAGDFDLAFCNGVFHHIPLEDRQAAAGQISNSLRPGGLLAFWENNPWNPGTRYVMSRIPFDRDAVMLSAREACVLLRSAGFETVRVDYAFVFPRLLSFLRPVEPYLARVPAGAQYQILARKPGGPSSSDRPSPHEWPR